MLGNTSASFTDTLHQDFFVSSSKRSVLYIELLCKFGRFLKKMGEQSWKNTGYWSVTLNVKSEIFIKILRTRPAGVGFGVAVAERLNSLELP